MEPTIKRRVFLNRAEEIAYEREQAAKEAESHGEVLPFKETDEGNEWGMPQWMMDITNAITLPRDTIQGYQPTGKDAANFALTVGGGGIAASTVTKPDADLGMFLGKKAKGADTKKLSVAMIQAGRGVDREQIWADTGWWQKPDGAWAWEIPDDDLAIDPSVLDTLKFIGGGTTSGKAKDIIKHPRLFDEYPPFQATQDQIDRGVVTAQQAKDAEGYGGIVSTAGVSLDPHGATHGVAKTDIGRLEITVGKENKPRELLAHELQHFVQAKEDWPGRGDNSGHTQDMINRLDNAAPKRYLDYKEAEDSMMYANRRLSTLKSDLDLAVSTLQEMQTDPRWSTWEGKQEIQAQEAMIRDMKDGIIDWKEELNVQTNKYDSLSRNPSVSSYREAREDFEKFFGSDNYQMYRRNEGEALANLTAQRLSLTPEERKLVPPWLMYGSRDPIFPDQNIPFEDQQWEPGQYDKFMKRFDLTAQPTDGPTSLEATGYHGSPSDFDKFDVKFMNTGEGAQSYGWGLYFAEDSGIARHYRNKLSKNQPSKILDSSGKEYSNQDGSTISYMHDVFQRLDNQSPKDYRDRLNGQIQRYESIVDNGFKDPNSGLKWDDASIFDELYLNRQRLNALDIIEEEGLTLQRPGKLYTVDIKANDDEFIDWDESVYNQSPAVAEKLKPYLVNDKELTNLVSMFDRWSDPDKGVYWQDTAKEIQQTLTNNVESEIEEGNLFNALKGLQFLDALHIWNKELAGRYPPEDFVEEMKSRMNAGELIRGVLPDINMWSEHTKGNFTDSEDIESARKAAEFLKSIGIKGTKFWDNNSRKNKQGKRNLVVYDDSLIEIKDKK